MRYFTDFIDERGLSLDEDGLRFASRQDACHAAAEALVEAVHDLLRHRSNRLQPGVPLALDLEALVRDETGDVIFRSRLALNLEWHSEPRERTPHQPQLGTGG